LDKTPCSRTSREPQRRSLCESRFRIGEATSDVNQQIARPGVRYSSKFVDLVPENTVFYAALPNLTETLAESQRVMQERISQNPALAEWWKGNKGDGLGINEQTLARVREFRFASGEEIVVSAEMMRMASRTAYSYWAK
jgi:hypothetical protein